MNMNNILEINQEFWSFNPLDVLLMVIILNDTQYSVDIALPKSGNLK